MSESFSGEVHYHRNGVSGEGFYVVRFTHQEGVVAQQMMAVVFLPEGAYDSDGYMLDPNLWPFHNCRVAVFDESLLPDVRFTINSWRGDHFAATAYRAIFNNEEAAISERGSR